MFALPQQPQGAECIRLIAQRTKDSEFQEGVKNVLYLSREVKYYEGTDPDYDCWDTDRVMDDVSKCVDFVLKYTKETNKTLSTEDKLVLKNAFIDLLDDVKSHMVAEINEVNQNQLEVRGLPVIDCAVALAIYAAKKFYTITGPNPPSKEQVVAKIDQVENSLESMERFANYEKTIAEKASKLSTRLHEEQEKLQTLQNIKDTFTGWFSFGTANKENEQLKPKASSEETLIWEQELRHYQDCLDVSQSLTAQHNSKNIQNVITPPRVDLAGQIDPILNFFYNMPRELTSGLIRNATAPFTPAQLFQGQSFGAVLSDKVPKLIEENAKIPSSLIPDFGMEAMENIRQRLANNLGLITQDNNLARLTIKTNHQLAVLLDAIDKSAMGESKEDFMQRLGAPFTSVDDYITAVHGSVIENLCKIAVIEQKKESGIENLWTQVGNFSSEGTIKIIFKAAFDKNDFSNKIATIGELERDDSILSLLTLGDQRGKINQHRDIALLFILNALVSEMTAIASEARKAEREGLPIDVSDIPDGKAPAKIRDSLLEVQAGIVQLGYVNKLTEHKAKPINTVALSETFGLFGELAKIWALSYVIGQQGEEGVVDLATPAYQHLVKQWTDWIAR